MELSKDGRTWRIGTARDVEWLPGRTAPHGHSVTVAIPPGYEAYATFHPADHAARAVQIQAHERAVVQELTDHTAGQPWWLGFLDTGATDLVFPRAPKVSLYWDWSYVLVLAGPEQALTWRSGHIRDGAGSLPDLFFPADRSWLFSGLWDDAWNCVGAPTALVQALVGNPLVNARQVRSDEDRLPPGLPRW